MTLWREDIVAYGILVIAIVVFGQLVFRGLQNPLNAVPGPAIARWTNLRLKFAVISGRRIHYVHSLHQIYGPYVRIGPHEVSVSDAEGFVQIHRIGSGFHKTQWYKKFVSFERLGVFSMTDPKLHAARRKLLARGFSKTYLRQFWEPVVHTKVKLAVSRMMDESKQLGSADVLKWWTFMATDVATHLMFGDSFHAIEQGEKTGYLKILESGLKGAGIGSELPVVSAIGKHLPIAACKDMFAANDILLETAQVAVTNANAGGEKNLFAHIIREADKGERLDDLDLKTEASSLIIAGSDTTAVTLTYLVWAVLSHPVAAESLYAEVAALPEDYSDHELEELPVLNAIVEETLRLYGAAPGGLPRKVPANGTHMGSYFFPAGTTVTTQAYTIHRDAELFLNPSSFDYTRWLPSSHPESSSANRSPKPDLVKTVFTPFGAGSRVCLGIHLARTELRLGTAEFFRRCRGAKLAPSTTHESMEMVNFFLIAPKSHRCDVIC